MNKKILMIYPDGKKEGIRFFPLGFYIASTILKHNGFNVECLDLSFYDDYNYVISNKIKDICPDILGFSVCGAVNYKFALDIISEMQLNKICPIVFGGQHMQSPTVKANRLYESVTGDLEQIEYFFGRKLLCTEMESVDYSIVPFFDMYYPSLEISRGCWNHCKFCNSNYRHVEKNIACIEKELSDLSNMYPPGTILTLGGSNHLFMNWKKNGLIDILLDYGKHFYFNFNLGVESGWENVWDDILKLNLWNIFVGIESCDEDTLVRMHKSKNPKSYVKKASDLFYRCKTDKIYLFATYIYGYPGNTVKDINKLDDFLMRHACNNVVQVAFPLEAYPGTELLIKRKQYEQDGVVYNKVYVNDIVEYYRLDISKNLKYEYLQERSKKICDIVNTKDKYVLNRCKGKSGNKC